MFYLVLRTLENPSQDIGITCTANGFYRNDSNEKTNQFSPSPSTRNPPCYSYTLAGTINQLSPAFSKNLQVYFNSILKTEPYFLSQNPTKTYNWIETESSESDVKITNNESIIQTLMPLYGLDPKVNRDWNEEFQVVKNFPVENFMQRVQKDRAINKVYNDFLDVAQKGAMAIVEGKLTPLNPNEPIKSHVYVFNQIFFSFAIDVPNSYSDCTSIENSPSFTQSNHDMLGLKQLSALDVEGLHLLATCLINFRGHRVICQSIIPGILNNSDLASMAEYGAVDDKKNIIATEQFHSLMLKVAEIF